MTTQEQETVNVEEMLKALQGFTEAPASVNFYGVSRKGWNLQWTLRGTDENELLDRFAAFTQKLEEKGVTPKPVGQQPAPRPDAPAGNIPAAPSPAPQGTNGNGTHDAHCVLIEVGTSYSGGKTQLLFNCDGLEHPLRFTKPVGEMVKLLAPLGYTAGHIVVGKKYGANATVRYTETTNPEGKTYKNVQSVTPK